MCKIGLEWVQNIQPKCETDLQSLESKGINIISGYPKSTLQELGLTRVC